MTGLGPFESRPRVVVAVSGGSDSMALALLAAHWARAQGGEAIAVTVDHGLRAESSAEAVRVACWMEARGIRHATLHWSGDKPATGIQAAARDARYGLLGAFCRSKGILHLLLAHHREDQAETLLLRLGRGSGVDGLSAMAPVHPTRWGRLLRPLLDIPRQRLIATLTASGQEWVEDLSNQDEAYARVRLRRLMPALAAEGLTAERLTATASRLGRVRAALEQATAEAAARWVEPHAAGFVRIRAEALAAMPEEIGLRLLARLIMAVGGGVHAPRLEALERLYFHLRAGMGEARTLGGCRLVPEVGEMIVCREPAKVAPAVDLVPGATVCWDGRFMAEVAQDAPAGLRLGALGGRRPRPERGASPLIKLPACVRPTLPAIMNEDGVSAVPHLGYNHALAEAALRRLDVAPAFCLTASAQRLVSA
ncbi:tRNA lysidine(34) synthetase TilS [Paramagnetospirillum kuznetsovii]|uniref:tRNA(Ile)-lysidine synthase n=2 Tax=Paramagnetospirillum kuznetsovii TaxID=2053833 RepID=A0A364NTU3_9PROT|nr:tRNA lysidine(34) synthetase TilS [Paramagnetospirillum kuznetsovii]